MGGKSQGRCGNGWNSLALFIQGLTSAKRVPVESSAFIRNSVKNMTEGFISQCRNNNSSNTTFATHQETEY